MAMVLLAYAAFILLLALPFILAMLVLGGLVAGGTWLARGIRAADRLTIAAALTLLAIAGSAGWFGWQYMAGWEVGEAVLAAEEPLTAAMAARPRTLQPRRGNDGDIVLTRLRDGSFDRVIGERRMLPMAGPPPGQSSYAFWDKRFEGRLKPGPACAATDADPRICFDFTPLEGPGPEAYFGLGDKTERDRMMGFIYFREGRERHYLYRCTVPIRRPRHPLFDSRFELAGGYRAGLEKERACLLKALDRLAADLARMQR